MRLLVAAVSRNGRNKSSAAVGNHKVVAIIYSILDDTGIMLQPPDIQEYYAHGGPNDLLQGLEGCQLGKTVEIVLSPEKAFGHHDPAPTATDDIENVPPQFRRVGAAVQTQDDQGEIRAFFASKIENDKLTVDGIHPFAGRVLTYAVTVADIRDASEEKKVKGVAKPRMH